MQINRKKNINASIWFAFQRIRQIFVATQKNEYEGVVNMFLNTEKKIDTYI